MLKGTLALIYSHPKANERMLFLCVYREGVESLLQQHTYARTPLRSFTDSDLDDPLKAAYASLKGQLLFTLTLNHISLTHVCILHEQY